MLRNEKTFRILLIVHVGVIGVAIIAAAIWGTYKYKISKAMQLAGAEASQLTIERFACSGFLESIFHQGDLDYIGKEKKHVLDLMKTKPTIVFITFDHAT